jgi:2-polyprenyl-3-methyl-5-hydroxy-6-metoxy-1,4-benzoquinol methylase
MPSHYKRMLTINNKCRTCGSTQTIFYFAINNLHVIRCTECSHVFLDTVHTESSIKSLYENYDNQLKSSYFNGITAVTRNNIKKYLKHCLNLLSCNNIPTLLDIGCGIGTLMEEAKKNGFITEGVEICRGLAKIAAKNTESTIHTDFLEKLPLPNEHYNVITMYDLLEHLKSPENELRHAHRILKRGGILFILCPNDNAMVRIISNYIYFSTFHLISKPMKILYYRDHLSYFTKKSLTTLLEKNGFEIISITTKNQELERLNLPWTYKPLAKTVFAFSHLFTNTGGKFVLYARKL